MLIKMQLENAILCPKWLNKLRWKKNKFHAEAYLQWKKLLTQQDKRILYYTEI